MSEFGREGPILLRAIFQTGDYIQLSAASSLIAGYRDFLRFASYVELDGDEIVGLLRTSSLQFDINESVTFGLDRFIFFARPLRAFDAVDYEFDKALFVEEINYRSPLEIIVQIATGVGVVGGVGWYIGRRALDLFQKYQEARRSKAETDYQVTAYNVLREELSRKRPELESNDSVHEAMSTGAQTLASLNRLDVSLPGRAPQRTRPQVEGPDDASSLS